MSDLAEGSSGLLHDVHSMDTVVNVDGVLPHHLVDDRMAPLFSSLLCGSHSALPTLGRKGVRDSCWSFFCSTVHWCSVLSYQVMNLFLYHKHLVRPSDTDPPKI